MSGSPKRCHAQLSAEADEIVAARRRERAQAEEEQRRRAEEARRAARLREARQAAVGAADAITQRAAQVQSGKTGRLVTAELEQCERRAGQLRAAVAAASSEQEVQRLNAELTELAVEMTAVAAAGDARLLAERLSGADKAALLVQSRHQSLNQRDSWKYDAEGYQTVTADLNAAQQAIARKRPDLADTHVRKAEERLERHVALVASRRREQADRKAAVVAVMDQATDQLAGLTADQVTSRWMPAEIEQLRHRMRQATDRVAAEQYDAAQTEARAVLATVPDLVAQAQELQLQQDRRDYIVAGIQEVMRQIGFSVGDPTLEELGDPRSPVRLLSYQPNGEPIEVSVPIDGEIWYGVSHRAIRIAHNAHGEAVSTCDAAEAQIELLHRDLSRQFGVSMSQLTWDAPSPELIDNVAMQLPDEAPASNHSSTTAQARSREI